jgi:hypothetical protein
MTDLEFIPRDYATDLDGGYEDGETPTVEIVRWYERPGWPLGQVPPGIAIAGAFAVGVLLGGASAWVALWLHDRYF